ncbi:MAG TPA: hypothetical protein VK504_08220 [Vicinamibacterales bacterium]|nr:hypothetical protein [Vicinamibacterales bacterium]
MPRIKTSGPVKTTLNLPEDAASDLRELAESRNVPYVEVVRRALAVEKYLDKVRKSGGKILVEDPEKVVKELVFF